MRLRHYLSSTRVLPALAGVIVLTTVTACGSSDSGSVASSSASSSSGAASTATLTGDPIKIGLALQLTGSQAKSISPTAPTAEAWTKWVNDNGGIGGHPVQVITGDSGGDPSKALSVMKDFTSQGVVAVMIQDPSVEGSVGDYLQGENIPVIGGQAYDVSAWGVRPNYFTMTTTPLTSPIALVTVAKEAGVKSLGYIACAEVAACSETVPVVQAAAEEAGLQYAGFATVAGSQPNYTAECVTLIGQGADGLGMALIAETAARMMQDCTQQGYAGKYLMASAVLDPEAMSGSNGTTVVSYSKTFPWWADAAPVQEFRDALKEYSPDVNIENSFVTSAWAGLELFRKAVTADPDNLTTDKVEAGYHGLKDETLDGLLPEPVNFPEGQPAPELKCQWAFNYTIGDDTSYKTVPIGPSGNTQSGELQSYCV